MTDDDKAHAVLEALAGVRRCSLCHEIELEPWLGLLERYNDLICFGCWMHMRRAVTLENAIAWRAEFLNSYHVQQ